MAQTVSDTAARTGRGAIQGSAGWVAAEFIDAFLWNMDERQYGIAVVILGVTVAFIQNVVENRLGIAFLKNIPAPDQKVVDEAGMFSRTEAFLIAILVGVVMLLFGVNFDQN